MVVARRFFRGDVSTFSPVGDSGKGCGSGGVADAGEAAALVSDADRPVEPVVQAQLRRTEQVGVRLRGQSDEGPGAHVHELAAHPLGPDRLRVADGHVVGLEYAVEVHEAVQRGQDDDAASRVGGDAVGGLTGEAVLPTDVEVAGRGRLGEFGTSAGDDDDGRTLGVEVLDVLGGGAHAEQVVERVPVAAAAVRLGDERAVAADWGALPARQAYIEAPTL